MGSAVIGLDVWLAAARGLSTLPIDAGAPADTRSNRMSVRESSRQGTARNRPRKNGGGAARAAPIGRTRQRASVLGLQSMDEAVLSARFDRAAAQCHKHDLYCQCELTRQAADSEDRAASNRRLAPERNEGYQPPLSHFDLPARTQAFDDAPVFLAEERLLSLLSARPPFGFNLNCAASGSRCVASSLCNMSEPRTHKRLSLPKLATLLRLMRAPEVRRFRSCAVVANSGTLLHRTRGDEIDRHEAVIRVQRPSLGPRYTAYVGKRTTWWVRGASWKWIGDEGDGVPIIPICNQGGIDFCWDTMADRVKRNKRLHAQGDRRKRQQVHPMNPVFFHALRNLTGGAIPLTGTAAVALAMRSCDRISAYGFYGNGDGREAYMYYYNCNQTQEHYLKAVVPDLWHDQQGNLRLLRHWNSTGRIRWNR